MHIVVLGAGALGAYFGARWAEAGAEVTFLVRDKRAAQIRKNGIRVNSTMGETVMEQPDIAQRADDIDDVDLVFVSVKGYHLSEALPNLRKLAETGAYFLPVLNGMEHIPLLQRELGREKVLGGLAHIMATLDDHGWVVHSGHFHALTFGALAPGQESVCKRLESLSETANMDAVHSDAVVSEMWKKYMFINAFAGITTATNLPIGPVREYTPTFEIAEQLLKEMQQLANAYDVPLEEADVQVAKDRLLGLGKDATSSMHQDRRKGLMLEVEHLHGGALRLAEEKGLKLPYTEAIYGLIKPFERPWRKRYNTKKSHL